MKYSKCLSYGGYDPTQTINPFLDSRISVDHDKVDGLAANGENLIKKNSCFSIVFFLNVRSKTKLFY